MADVIPFARPEPPEREEVHTLAGEAICAQCRHTFQARVPVGQIWTECPNCLTNKAAIRYTVGPSVGDIAYSCKLCGSDAITAFKRGRFFYLICMCCGADHTAEVFREHG